MLHKNLGQQTARVLATAAVSVALAAGSTGVAQAAERQHWHPSHASASTPHAHSKTAEPKKAKKSPPRPKPASKTKKALVVAASLKGRPYRYGATGPNAFDCSGYTKYVMAKVGERLPRTAADQYRASHHRSHAAMKPGDLVFVVWHGQITHVGIYAGHGMMWHAPHTGSFVREESVRGVTHGEYLVGSVLPS